MQCKYCHVPLTENSVYCHMCGKKQIFASKRRHLPRAQAQGSITKIPGNRRNPYWARLPAEYSSGSTVRKSLGCFSTYKAAAEALSKAIYLPAKSESSVTLQHLYDRFIDSHYYASLSKSAQGSHRTAWKHLVVQATIPVSKINKDTFQIPINQMNKAGLKRESLAKARNLCSLLCKEAMGMGLLTVNYGQLVQLPKKDSTPIKPFSNKDIKKLWEAFDLGNKDVLAVLILVYTGMRPSELLCVAIETHLHIDGEYWYIKTGSKTEAGKNRIIPIPRALRPVIERACSGRHSGPLIMAEHGGFYRLDNWRPRCFNPLMRALVPCNNLNFTF